MNDDFLHRLRKQPSQAFAARLKAKLERQMPQRPRISVVRSLVLGLLVGGSAVAATWWMVQGTGSEELRPAVSRVSGSNAPTSEPESQGVTAQQRSFFGGAADEEASSSARASVASSPIGKPSTEARADEITAGTASHDGVIGGYAKSSRSTRSETEKSPYTRAVRAAGHESGLVLMEAVNGRNRTFELTSSAVDDEEAFRRLCTTQRADVVVTTRSMSEDERRECEAKLGFKADRIKMLKLGHMGAAISAAKYATTYTLSPRDLFLALAKRIPDGENPTRFIPNPNVSWHQVGAYGERRITVFGPERDSPRAKGFAAIIMKAGCDTFPSIKSLRETDPDEYRRLCSEIREDPVYTPISYENEFFVTQTLWGDPHAIAVLSLPFFDARRADLNGSVLSGPAPTPEAIASGAYEGAITLYFYARVDTNAQWLARDMEHAIESPTHLANYGLLLDAAQQDH